LSTDVVKENKSYLN